MWFASSTKWWKSTIAHIIVVLQLVAQRIKVKSMDARMDMEAQYGEEIRDTRTIRQKVQL